MREPFGTVTNVGSYFCRGFAKYKKSDYDWAIEDYDEAIRIDPKYQLAYVGRGRAWKAKKEYDKAIWDYGKAIRIDPTFATGYRFLAWLLATCPEERVRDCKRAIQLATKACELTDWKHALGLDTLAAAYADAGQFDEAERYQTKALEIPVYRGLAGDEFRQRLELYKQKKPFRESTFASSRKH